MNLPSAAPVSPWPELLQLITQKITFKGTPVAGTPEQIKGFAGWLMQQLPGVVSDGDVDHRASCLLLWLRSENRYEADAATRVAQQGAVTQAPPNPISHQIVPQQAVMAPPVPQPVAVVAPVAEEAEAGPGLVCPECGTKATGIRGMKRHVTMTHHTEWPAFCAKHGVDQKTFAPVALAAPAPATAVPPPPVAAPVAPMFQATGPAQPFAAPAPPPMPSPAAMVAAPVSIPQHTTHPQMVYTGPAKIPAQAVNHIVQGYAAPSVDSGIPQSVSPFTPPAMQQPVVAPAPPMVAFDPSTVQPGLPGQQTIPFVVPAPPVPVGGPSRDDLAKMLGGPVDLIVVRLLDAATVNLQGRVDVNQIAAVAELRARAEMKVVDLAQSSYGQGKQAAQRHFADLLTQAPGCYLLLNGYEPIIPDGYLNILASRVVKFHMVTDGGRQTTTIF